MRIENSPQRAGRFGRRAPLQRDLDQKRAWEDGRGIALHGELGIRDAVNHPLERAGRAAADLAAGEADDLQPDIRALERPAPRRHQPGPDRVFGAGKKRHLDIARIRGNGRKRNCTGYGSDRRGRGDAIKAREHQRHPPCRISQPGKGTRFREMRQGESPRFPEVRPQPVPDAIQARGRGRPFRRSPRR